MSFSICVTYCECSQHKMPAFNYILSIHTQICLEDIQCDAIDDMIDRMWVGSNKIREKN